MENAASSTVKKYQNLIFPIVAVIIGLVILGLVIVPQGLKIPETNKQIDSARQDLTALNLKISQLNGVDINQYQSDLNNSLVSLPSEKDIPGLIVLITNLLQNNGLTLSGLSFSGTDTAANGATMFLVKVEVTGTRDSLSSMIGQLKQSPRIVKAETLSTSGAGNSTTMEILIGMDSYYQPLPTSQNLDVNKPVELPTQANKQTLDQIKGYQAQNANLLIEATASGNIQLGKPDPFQ